jgi:hypothetical protein
MAPASATSAASLALGTRLWFAWACFFRVLLDGAFARRAWDVRDGVPELPPPTRRAARGDGGEEDEPPRKSMDAPSLENRRRMAKTVPEPRPDPLAVAAARETGALALLALLQREGRLVDFLQQDVTSFADEDMGAAARVVHAGCGKALREHATIDPVRTEEEGAAVELPEGYEASSVKLVGDVKGSPPYSGTLRHRGWRASKVKLPEPVAGHDVRVLAPAEVEL